MFVMIYIKTACMQVIFESFCTFPRPYNIPEAIKGKMFKPFFYKIFSTHLPRFKIAAGNIWKFIEPFLEVFEYQLDSRFRDLFYIPGIVELPDNTLCPP